MFAIRRSRRGARLAIQLDLDRSEIAGVIHSSTASRSFDGWLELTAALAEVETEARFTASGTARRAEQRRQAALRVSDPGA